MNHVAIPPAIAAQLALARAVLERQLGANLQSLHLFGSALDGGLQPRSDMDLLATVAAPLSEAERRALMSGLLQVSAPPGAPGPLRPLELTLLVRAHVVPWRYPPLRELQFGEWLREPLQAGIVAPPERDPDIAILLHKARQHSIALTGPAAAECFAPVPARDFRQALADTVAQWNAPEDWEGDECNVVLALARIWFSQATGGIAPKHVAADWVLERLPAAHRPVLARARAAYVQGVDDRLADLGAELAAFVRHARAAIEDGLRTG
ncbi:streptomycin 3'-adenylyltransferase [Variovorax sp. TBS-050B]|uniref:aminoglycoside adenylyltransferase family protein n=1 Tax=Variovorax sp. TBS-050B TaxID=2940551 RepID=UPI0024742AF4|nr:aminoglycoside adenylyltransferase family protein [Variovorax sp. TBS-050B]MDH6590429.1 streptomycin 3'-adenylyltransferase [Variovorax sp. TBS-050B]